MSTLINKKTLHSRAYQRADQRKREVDAQAFPVKEALAQMYLDGYMKARADFREFLSTQYRKRRAEYSEDATLA